MELIFRLSLLIAGVINLLPSFLAFLPNKISRSYGIEMPNKNIELLIRHRAILFGIIGGLMIYASLVKMYYDLATIVGLISMVSFILLYFKIGKEININLQRVMIIDIVGTIILCLGFILYQMFP